MHKDNHFFRTAVFGQLISHIHNGLIEQVVKSCKSDYYTKRFTTKDHLVSMLFCAFAKCNSLREVSGALLGLGEKTKRFGLQSLPHKSTLADANKRRNYVVFEQIYHKLLRKYQNIFSDSRFKEAINKRVEIFDSTTITLFQEILKCAGRKPIDGKSKGGIKVHTIINAYETVPQVVWFTPAATNDHVLLDKLQMSKDKIYVFDKGYNDYRIFDKLTQAKTGFVTRIRDNAVYKIIEDNEIEEFVYAGVVEDTTIEVRVKCKEGDKKLRLRKVCFIDRFSKRKFEFLTNMFEFRADMITGFYKIRWQIETLFKQLKQNFPLKYFLGDHENAIKIQIYCALIANLLMTIIQKKVKDKRHWAFSNLVCLCRIHLFNNIHLINFLKNPEYNWKKSKINTVQFALF